MPAHVPVQTELQSCDIDIEEEPGVGSGVEADYSQTEVTAAHHNPHDPTQCHRRVVREHEAVMQQSTRALAQETAPDLVPDGVIGAGSPSTLLLEEFAPRVRSFAHGRQVGSVDPTPAAAGFFVA